MHSTLWGYVLSSVLSGVLGFIARKLWEWWWKRRHSRIIKITVPTRVVVSVVEVPTIHPPK